MINGMPIFYSSKTGSGLKVVSTNKVKDWNQFKLKKEKDVTKNAIKRELMVVV